MSQSEHDRRIDYIEFTTRNVADARRFYGQLFDWSFEDYGPEYTSFHDGRLAGGFSAGAGEKPSAPLVVIYATDLEAMAQRVVEAGGKIVRPAFSFPGGRRFHFTDPSGNELAVWSEQ